MKTSSVLKEKWQLIPIPAVVFHNLMPPEALQKVIPPEP
jgi:hypothetical protein